MNDTTEGRAPGAKGPVTTAGASSRLVQGASRRLRIVAHGPAVAAGYVLREQALVDDRRIVAQARLVDDALRIGSGAVIESFALTIRALPDAGEGERMLLMLDPAQDASEMAATLLLPGRVFTALGEGCAAGEASRITLAALTNLWIDEAERDAVAGLPVTWRFGAEADGSTMPARGLVESIAWDNPIEEEAPVAPAPAEPDEAAETAAEAIGRVNWSLKQIALALVFLLIIVALK